MSIIINPGADWHPTTHSPEQAAANLAEFVRQVQATGKHVRHEPIIGDATEVEAAQMMGGTKYQADHDGRYPFRVIVDGASHLVEMPGIPLAETEYHSGTGQDPWDFPRLFVDGSSWLWSFALKAVLESDDRTEVQLHGNENARDGRL